MDDRALEIKFYYYLQRIFIDYEAQDVQTILEFVAGMNSSQYCTLDDLMALWNKLMVTKEPYYIPLRDDAIWFLYNDDYSVRDIVKLTGACKQHQANQIKFYKEHPDQQPDNKPRFKDIFNEQGELIASPHIAMKEFIETIDKFTDVFRGKYERKKYQG